jgi:hypothetical protein
MMAMLKKLGDDIIHEIKTTLTKAQSERSGSKLSTNHLKCFGTIATLEISELTLSPDPDPHSDGVAAKVADLALRLIALYKLKSTRADEVDDIQPLTFDFFEKTCQLYFPDLWNRGVMSLRKKNTDGDTYYHVNLIDESGHIHPVNGETDSTLYYKGIPVGVWKNKNFSFKMTNYTNAPEVAQAFAELQYSAGEISKRISQQLRLCSGILTSGLNWTLMIKSCRKGNILHDRTIPICLIDTSQTPPVATNVDEVTKLVLFHLQVIQANIRLLKTSFSKSLFDARIDEEDEEEDDDDEEGQEEDHDDKEDDEEDDEEDEEEEDEKDEKEEDEEEDEAPEDDDDTEPATKKPRIVPSVGRSGGGGRRVGGKGKGSGQQGGGRNTNLQLQSSNSQLTLENVYKFNLSQPTFLY